MDRGKNDILFKSEEGQRVVVTFLCKARSKRVYFGEEGRDHELCSCSVKTPCIMNTEQHMDDLDNLFLGLHKKMSERQTKAGNLEVF